MVFVSDSVFLYRIFSNEIVDFSDLIDALLYITHVFFNILLTFTNNIVIKLICQLSEPQAIAGRLF